MTVLVAYASKHGATREIAERIADKLQRAVKEAEVRAVKAVTTPENYEAFVIGSAVYYGSWLTEATDWTLHNQNILAGRPVWLFSSGPLGNEVTDAEQQPKEMAEFRETIAPRDQRIFFGALDPVFLSFPERMMAKAVRAPKGDYRDWEAVDRWAESIARNLG